MEGDCLLSIYIRKIMFADCISISLLSRCSSVQLATPTLTPVPPNSCSKSLDGNGGITFISLSINFDAVSLQGELESDYGICKAMMKSSMVVGQNVFPSANRIKGSVTFDLDRRLNV